MPSECETPLTLPPPTVADDTAFAVEAAALVEADVVRAQRRLDTLEQRVAALGAKRL